MIKLNFQVSCEFICEMMINTDNELYAVEVLTRFYGGCSMHKMDSQSFINSLYFD